MIPDRSSRSEQDAHISGDALGGWIATSGEEALSKYTNGSYWAERPDADSTYKVQLMLAMLRRAGVPLTNGIRIVEVGCGPGAFLIPLARYLRSGGMGAHLRGYDVSPQAIAAADERTENIPGLSFEVGTAANVGPGADFILVMDVIEHLENPAQFLRDLANKSRYLVLHLPVEQSLGHLIMRKPTASHKAFSHIHFYSFETSRLLIEDSPFTIISSQASASHTDSIRVARSVSQKVLQMARIALYRLFPQYAPILAGGTVMWLLENRSPSPALREPSTLT